MSGEKLPRLLLPREAAAILRVHPDTLRDWVKAGRISAVMLPSGTYRYREADIRALVEGDK